MNAADPLKDSRGMWPSWLAWAVGNHWQLLFYTYLELRVGIHSHQSVGPCARLLATRMCRVLGTSIASLIPGHSGAHVPGTWVGKAMKGVGSSCRTGWSEMVGVHLGLAFNSVACVGAARSLGGLVMASSDALAGLLSGTWRDAVQGC